MDCRLQKRCMCLSFKRHPELQFFRLSPSLCLSLPLPFFPPSPRHLVLLRHSYKHAAQVPARRDAGAGRGSISPGPEQALFQKVQGGSVSFFMSNPGTGTAPGAAAASLRAGRESCPPPHLAAHRSPPLPFHSSAPGGSRKPLPPLTPPQPQKTRPKPSARAPALHSVTTSSAFPAAPAR